MNLMIMLSLDAQTEDPKLRNLFSIKICVL